LQQQVKKQQQNNQKQHPLLGLAECVFFSGVITSRGDAGSDAQGVEKTNDPVRSVELYISELSS